MGSGVKFYQINPAANESVQVNLSNMEPILREIAVTYRVLDNLLQSYGQSTDIPAINDYRAQIRAQVAAATASAEAIAAATSKFTVILKELNKEISRLN